MVDSGAKTLGASSSLRSILCGSDHENFVNLGVPSVHVTTGTHEDWHTSEDTFARLNVAGERRVLDVVERLVRVLADSAVWLRQVRR